MTNFFPGSLFSTVNLLAKAQRAVTNVVHEAMTLAFMHPWQTSIMLLLLVSAHFVSAISIESSLCLICPPSGNHSGALFLPAGEGYWTKRFFSPDFDPTATCADLAPQMSTAPSVPKPSDWPGVDGILKYSLPYVQRVCLSLIRGNLPGATLEDNECWRYKEMPSP